jgi:hypothetical protein
LIASSSIATPANHELVWGTTAFTTVTIFPREQNGQTPFGSKRGERDQEGMQIMKSATGGGIGLTQLTSHPSTERYPDWSPDGTKIAFGQTPDDLYVMNADGSGVTELISGPSSDLSPTWSPDGTKIAFTAGDASGGYTIYTS